MTKRRLLPLLALGLAVVAAAGWSWRQSRGKARPQLETAKLERGRLVARVTATGTLSAIVTVQVGSQVSGRVQAIHADYNSRVKKGQLIAKIDPQLFAAARAQARANLVAAEGNLARAQAQALDAQRQHRRQAALAAEKLVATADLETAEANRDAADAQVRASQGAVAQARAALHQAEVNLEYTNILSPTNGIVISRNVDVGQTVAASLQAPILFVIAEDLAKMQVDTSVVEADVGRLQDGMAASFTVDAYPGEVFRGRVRQIRNAATTVQNVVTYDAVIDVENPELKLRPGMTANVTFVYAERDDVLRVPNAALRFRPPAGLVAGADPARAPGAGGSRGGGRSPGAALPQRPDGPRTVYVVRGEQVEPVRVRTGLTDGSFTEIVEGALEPGDVVVTDATVPGATASPGGMPAGMRRPF